MPTEKVKHLGVEYVDPHMWIIALIGSAAFTLKTASISKARKNKNHINISIVGLSDEPMLLHRAKNYKTVC